MSITYLDVQRNNLIDEKVLGVLPDKCECGGRLKFNESLKEISCTSDNCESRLVYRIQAFCNEFKLSLSKESTKRIIENSSILSPYQLMLIPDSLSVGQLLSVGVNEAEDFVGGIRKLRERPTKLGEILRASGIDTFEFVADKLTDGIYSFDELFNELDKSQLSFVNERLGAFGSAAALGTVILDSLTVLKEELLFAEKQFNLWEEHKKIMRLAFCDNVKPFLNRSELLYYLNTTYCEYKFVMDAVVTDKTDVLIFNANSGNSKLRDANIINDLYSRDLVSEQGIELKDIGKISDTEIKPLGSKVYVVSTEEFIAQLNKVLKYN